MDKKTDKESIVSCPTCKTEVVWNKKQKFRPFCSHRCRLIDLGEWAAEEKRIPGESVNVESHEENDGFLH